MRETWSGGIKAWDEPLRDDLASKWKTFLVSLLQLQDVEFPRSLWPEEEKPTLEFFSDGPASAFGAVAYIRWRLKSGKFWSRLIMAIPKAWFQFLV